MTVRGRGDGWIRGGKMRRDEAQAEEERKQEGKE